jgi:hypothetical protein
VTIASLVAAGRAAHDRLLVDTCTVTREIDGSFDDTTGKRAKIAQTIYTGVCRVKVATLTQAEAADRKNVVSSPMLHLPASDVSDIRERDVVTVDTSLTTNLVGVTFSVIGAEVSTTATARKFAVERRA